MKRLARMVLVAVMFTAASAEAASAQHGAPDFDVKENLQRVKAVGPGFRITMTHDGIRTRIDPERFGMPSAGFPIQEAATDLSTARNLRPIQCDHGTYRIISGIFRVTQRTSSTERRPLPYTPVFGQRFPNIFTFVGTLDGVVENEHGERFRLLMTDLAHEVLTADSFSSTAPIHAFIVDERGRVHDWASLVGRVNVDRVTGEAEHRIVDRGTCHQTANSNFGPNTDRTTVFGPFFVLPFNTEVGTRWPRPGA